MRTAFLLPGQGENLAPFLADWVDRSAAVRHRIAQAAEALGTTIPKLLSRGCRSLGSTRVYQPISTALCLGIAQELQARGIWPAMVAGHSLGELPAAVIAGFLAPEDAIDVACLRGGVMAQEAGARAGGMAAAPTADPDVLGTILATAEEGEVLVVAGHNSPVQTVFSGDVAAVSRITPPATWLRVEGAWHSPLMDAAVAPYRAALERVVNDFAGVPMVFNGTGRLEKDPGRVSDLLAGQLNRPVRWTHVVATVRSLAPERFISLGPSRVLRAVLRDQAGPPMKVLPVETFDDLPGTESRWVS